MTFAVRLSIVGCLLSATALAQGQQWQVEQMQGVFTSASVGIVSNGQVLVRSPGVVNGPPTEWSDSRFGAVSYDHPDYSNTALLYGINKLVSNPQLQATTVGFGGISTGGDVCPPINAQGELQLYSSWYFLSVTVGARPNATGVPGSVLASLANPTQSILSYYAENSSGINSNLINATVAEQTSAQLLGSSTPANFEVSELDWGMGFISVDPYGTRSRTFAPCRDKFFFTLTSAWLNSHPAFVAVSPLTLTPATIYVMTWDWDSARSDWAWTAPAVAATADELLGVYSHAGEEIDALSVFYRAGTTPIMRVVFSMTRSNYPAVQAPGYQLLGYDSQNSTPAAPLKTVSGILVAERLGLIITGGPTEVDNVTGTCGGDPEGGVLDSVVGTPMSWLGLGSGPPLGLAVYRSITISDVGVLVDSVNLQVSGIKLPDGFTGQVRYQVGATTPEGVSESTGKTYSWLPIGVVNVGAGSTTASLELPGDLGNLGPVSVSAILYLTNSSTPLRSSWMSVLDY